MPTDDKNRHTATRPGELELLHPRDVDNLRDSLRAVNITMTRVEQISAKQLVAIERNALAVETMTRALVRVADETAKLTAMLATVTSVSLEPTEPMAMPAVARTATG